MESIHEKGQKFLGILLLGTGKLRGKATDGHLVMGEGGKEGGGEGKGGGRGGRKGGGGGRREEGGKGKGEREGGTKGGRACMYQ